MYFMPIARTLNHNFFKTWTPEMAYVLGYFAADGSMIRHKNGGCFIEFTTTDRCLLEQLKLVTCASQKIAERPFRHPQWKTQYRIQIGSKQWFNDLLAHGFTPRKSKSMHFVKISAPYFGDFIRGYFDGDGCVYFKTHWVSARNRFCWVFTTSFTSGSREFLEALCESLRNYGVKGGHIARKERGFALVFSRHDSLALYRIMYNTGLVSSLYLPRKRDTFEEAIQTLDLRP